MSLKPMLHCCLHPFRPPSHHLNKISWHAYSCECKISLEKIREFLIERKRIDLLHEMAHCKIVRSYRKNADREDLAGIDCNALTIMQEVLPKVLSGQKNVVYMEPNIKLKNRHLSVVAYELDRLQEGKREN